MGLQDSERDRKLSEKGWKVLRITNHEVDYFMDDVITRIRKLVKVEVRS